MLQLHVEGGTGEPALNLAFAAISYHFGVMVGVIEGQDVVKCSHALLF